MKIIKIYAIVYGVNNIFGLVLNLANYPLVSRVRFNFFYSYKCIDNRKRGKGEGGKFVQLDTA